MSEKIKFLQNRVLFNDKLCGKTMSNLLSLLSGTILIMDMEINQVLVLIYGTSIGSRSKIDRPD